MRKRLDFICALSAHSASMKLQDWMKAEKLNDAALSQRVAGISRSQINRIRRGDSTPSPRAARELERVTGIPAAVLIFGEGAERAA